MLEAWWNLSWDMIESSLLTLFLGAIGGCAFLMCILCSLGMSTEDPPENLAKVALGLGWFAWLCFFLIMLAHTLGA